MTDKRRKAMKTRKGGSVVVGAKKKDTKKAVNKSTEKEKTDVN